MVGLVLNYILGCEACELRFCTMRLYFKHRFIYQPTSEHLYFLLLCKSIFGVFVLIIIKLWKKTLVVT